MIEYEGHTLEVTTDWIDVTPVQEPDPGWTETDAAGHVHTYDDTADGGPYPTLTWKRKTVFCGECQEDEDLGHLVCKQCGERVTPGFRAGTPKKIPGLSTYLLDGAPVSKTTAEDFMAARLAELLAAAPETYHGVTVPEKVRLNWDTADAWRAGVRAGLGVEE